MVYVTCKQGEGGVPKTGSQISKSPRAEEQFKLMGEADDVLSDKGKIKSGSGRRRD